MAAVQRVRWLTPCPSIMRGTPAVQTPMTFDDDSGSSNRILSQFRPLPVDLRGRIVFDSSEILRCLFPGPIGFHRRLSPHATVSGSAATDCSGSAAADQKSPSLCGFGAHVVRIFQRRRFLEASRKHGQLQVRKYCLSRLADKKSRWNIVRRAINNGAHSREAIFRFLCVQL